VKIKILLTTKQKKSSIKFKNNKLERKLCNKKANLEIDTKQDINSTLPDINKFPITVEPYKDQR
jgi:hypothetical protein